MVALVVDVLIVTVRNELLIWKIALDSICAPIACRTAWSAVLIDNDLDYELN